jgi:hypothetical protein
MVDPRSVGHFPASVAVEASVASLLQSSAFARA